MFITRKEFDKFISENEQLTDALRILQISYATILEKNIKLESDLTLAITKQIEIIEYNKPILKFKVIDESGGIHIVKAQRYYYAGGMICFYIQKDEVAIFHGFKVVVKI